jgi:hypothetical protein
MKKYAYKYTYKGNLMTSKLVRIEKLSGYLAGPSSTSVVDSETKQFSA